MRLALSLVCLVAVIGCGGTGGAKTPGTTTVGAEEKEFSIVLDKTTVPAGNVTFAVRNAGAIVHEFVVLDTDTPAGQLPQAGDEVSEDALTVVDEIEDIEPSANPSLDLTLTPGHYAIICNVPGHYAAGMHADLTVQ
jgi:uncharacterized cupredoxin-like copper-binding protein